MVLGLTALSTPALAQESQQDGEFSVQRFEPSPGPRNYLNVAGARTDGELAWSAGLFFDYARDPFVLRSCVSETDCADANAVQQEDVHVVQDMFTWNAMASFTPHPMVQLGLRLPVALVLGDGLGAVGAAPTPDSLSAVGMGDPTLETKVRFFGEPADLVALGAALDLSAPVGHATAENAFIGNASPITIGLRAIFDLKIGDGGIAANLRGIYRKDGTVGTTAIGPEFQWGVAGGYQINEVIRVLANGYGATRFQSQNGTNSVEIDGGIDLTPGDLGLHLTLAGGAGVVQGIGVPAGRAIFGISYVFEQADQDGDGIPDESDQCPTSAEDPDGLEDQDGCPEDDVDKDGIADDVDKCPTESEIFNGVDDEDGCPDQAADRDGDGVADAVDVCPDQAGKSPKPYLGCPNSDGDQLADLVDKCPNEAEDYDGIEDDDGCPEDNDHDGVPDEADECFDEPEIFNGVDDTDGCPDEAPDRDRDGIADANDRCPDREETLNGVNDDDGCDDGTALVGMKSDSISLRTEVRFDGANLSGDMSQKAIAAVANGLKNFQTIFLVEVRVVAKDEALAKGRANTIVQRMTASGVAPGRLRANATVGESESLRFEVVKSFKKK